MLQRVTVALSIVAILLSVFPSAVSADGMILPESAFMDYMVVRYHDVKVDIKDTFAFTSVEQEFYNPHSYEITGHYVFPIPPGAGVTNFQATFDGQRQTVLRQDRSSSNAILYNMIATHRDPSLLQYTDWETLTFEINIPAKSARKMTLSYQEVLPPSNDMLHYRYVLSTERYSGLPLERASITVNVSSSKGIGSLYSSSHDVVTEYFEPGKAKVSWEVFDNQPVNDFHLFITPAEGGFGGGFLTGHHQDTDHFLFMFSPEKADRQQDALPKDIVFVIDRSGSMAGEKINHAQEALHFILNQLNAYDRFSIIGFDDVFNVVADELLPINRENLASGHRFVSQLYDRNGTNIEGALQVGLRILNHSASRTGASQMIIFLTDGLPTEGITDPEQIVELISTANQSTQARLHVFGVGYDVNTHLLDQLAGQNGGSVTYVQPGENLEAVLSGFYERIAHPVLTDISITFEGIAVDKLYPQQLPDLFENSSLLLTGLYEVIDEGNAKITVRGNANGEKRTYTYEINLATLEPSAFVPGLWATRRIGHLLDVIRVEGESTSLVAQVRELGLSYGLVTPYTTFIITAQTEGAASAENMALYGNTYELNQASGRTTIQARVQNQSYQQATQVDFARGANVLNQDGQNMVQMSNQIIDLNLLHGYDHLEQPITDAWITANIKTDRQISFGSEAYFALAKDPVARAFMQNGNHVLFALKGEIIEIRDDTASESPDEEEHTYQDTQGPVSQSLEQGYTVYPRITFRTKLGQFFRDLLKYLIK